MSPHTRFKIIICLFKIVDKYNYVVEGYWEFKKFKSLSEFLKYLINVLYNSLNKKKLSRIYILMALNIVSLCNLQSNGRLNDTSKEHILYREF